MLNRAFRVTADYIDWAHAAAADEGNRLAVCLVVATVYGSGNAHSFHLFNTPELVAEIADVAEFYSIGAERDRRAAAVYSQAMKWLRSRGLSKKALITQFAAAINGDDGADS